MENASKALLIAGAILLVIAIIAIAVGIVGRTRGTINEAEMQIDTMKIQMHNNQFLQYEGKGKDYYEVREILSEATAYNSNLKSAELKVQVKTYYYTNTANTTMTSSPDCTLDPKSAYSGSCYLFRSSTSNYLYDIFCEYDSNGIIKYLKLVRYYTT